MRASYVVVDQVPTLTDEDVHVWSGNVPPEYLIESLGRTLSPAEAVRAERFHFLRDRYQFITARGATRLLLAQYLQISPSNLEICYTPAEKPILGDSLAHSGIQFSVSHCAGVILIAFGRSRPVGVDIEQVRNDFSYDDLVARFFAAHEQQLLQDLPLEQRRNAFFALWTRKEAYLKAIGTGITSDLDGLDVTDETFFAQRGWSILDLPSIEGFASAAAVQGHPFRMSTFAMGFDRLLSKPIGPV